MLQHRERSPWLNRVAVIPGGQNRTPATGGAQLLPTGTPVWCCQQRDRRAKQRECTGGSWRCPTPVPPAQDLRLYLLPTLPPAGRDAPQRGRAAPGASPPPTGTALPEPCARRSPLPHPLPRKAARPRRGSVREELVQARLPLLLHAVARGDRQQVNAQLVQGVAQQLPVVIDGVQGAAGRGDARGALGQGEVPGPTAAAPLEPCPSGSCLLSSSLPAPLTPTRTRSTQGVTQALGSHCWGSPRGAPLPQTQLRPAAQGLCGEAEGVWESSRALLGVTLYPQVLAGAGKQPEQRSVCRDWQEGAPRTLSVMESHGAVTARCHLAALAAPRAAAAQGLCAHR